MGKRPRSRARTQRKKRCLLIPPLREKKSLFLECWGQRGHLRGKKEKPPKNAPINLGEAFAFGKGSLLSTSLREGPVTEKGSRLREGQNFTLRFLHSPKRGRRRQVWEKTKKRKRFYEGGNNCAGGVTTCPIKTEMERKIIAFAVKLGLKKGKNPSRGAREGVF